MGQVDEHGRWDLSPDYVGDLTRENERLRAELDRLKVELFDAQRLAHTNCRTCWDETYLGVGKPCPDCNDEDWL